MIDAGVPVDSHESDLYVKLTPESVAILENYEHRDICRPFQNQIDGLTWVDVPFAFEPFWDAVKTRAGR